MATAASLPTSTSFLQSIQPYIDKGNTNSSDNLVSNLISYLKKFSSIDDVVNDLNGIKALDSLSSTTLASSTEDAIKTNHKNEQQVTPTFIKLINTPPLSEKDTIQIPGVGPVSFSKNYDSSKNINNYVISCNIPIYSYKPHPKEIPSKGASLTPYEENLVRTYIRPKSQNYKFLGHFFMREINKEYKVDKKLCKKNDDPTETGDPTEINTYEEDDLEERTDLAIIKIGQAGSLWCDRTKQLGFDHTPLAYFSCANEISIRSSFPAQWSFTFASHEGDILAKKSKIPTVKTIGTNYGIKTTMEPGLTEWVIVTTAFVQAIENCFYQYELQGNTTKVTEFFSNFKPRRLYYKNIAMKLKNGNLRVRNTCVYDAPLKESTSQAQSDGDKHDIAAKHETTEA